MYFPLLKELKSFFFPPNFKVVYPKRLIHYQLSNSSENGNEWMDSRYIYDFKIELKLLAYISCY